MAAIIYADPPASASAHTASWGRWTAAATRHQAARAVSLRSANAVAACPCPPCPHMVSTQGYECHRSIRSLPHCTAGPFGFVATRRGLRQCDVLWFDPDRCVGWGKFFGHPRRNR